MRETEQSACDREREGIRRDMEDVQEGVMSVLPADH